MASEHLFRPRLAASTYEASQPDPDASLGGFQSSTSIADVESTFTSVTSDRVVIDTGLPAGDFLGAWVVFLDTNLNEVREIIAYDEGTKTMTFAEDLPATPLVGDRYWLFLVDGLFSSFDADLCRRRATRYRLAYVKNETGAQLDSVRCYVSEIQAGPLACDLAMATSSYPQSSHYDVDDIADEETEPQLLGSAGGSFGNTAQDFLHKRAYDQATQSPHGTEGATGEKSIRDVASVNADRPLWVRLRFDDESPIPLPSTAVFQVFIDANDGATVSSFLVVVSIDGVPEEIVATVDRRLRIAGGARLSCYVRDSVAPNEGVPGRTIAINLDSGPGSMNAQSDTVQREDNVPIRRVYISPTDPAQAGQSVTFSFEVT